MQEMEACWPSSVGLSGAGAKPPCAALAEDRRGERQGEGAALTASGGDREDDPESGQVVWRGRVSLLRRRKAWLASKPGVLGLPSGRAWRVPVLLARWCPA